MNVSITSFQTVLDSLLDTKKEFPRRYLTRFSDMGTLELKTFLDVWERVGLSRKLSLLEVLKSLAETDTLVSFDDLARALLTDPEPSVRTLAIRLLGECEDARLIPAYLDLLKNDPDSNVRAEAATVLNLFVDLGELEEISEEAYSEVHAALMESASGADEMRVRRHALESLGFSSRPEVIPLIEAAFQRESPDWKTSALVAMGRSADDRWEDVVLLSLLDENDAIRKAAVQTAGELSLRSARMVLLRILAEGDDDEITAAAIWSLSQIGGEDVRTFLESLLDQSDDDEQTAFLEEALDNLSFTEDLDRFELLALDPDDLDDLKEIEEFDDEEDE
jgi:HEAT repeat protein